MPLCGCINSRFAPACLECGASFDEEEMDEAIRRQFAAEGERGASRVLRRRLAEKPENSDLLYARGLVLQTMGRTDDAMAALDRAAAAHRTNERSRSLSYGSKRRSCAKPDAAEKLRSTASALLDDVAWDQEGRAARRSHLRGGTHVSELRFDGPEKRRTLSVVRRAFGHRPIRTGGEAAPRGAPELDVLVDDLLVGELEKSLSLEELELTKAAVLDWLIEELEETMGVDATIKAAAEKRAETKTPVEPSPVPPAVGFLSGWMRGSKGLVSGRVPRPRRAGPGR